MTSPPDTDRSANLLSAVAVAMWLAAAIVTLSLWPKGGDAATPAEAITAGGVLAVAGAVLWVGAVLVRK